MKLFLAQQATNGVVSSQWSFPPQKLAGSTIVHGGIIDRLNYREAILGLCWAAATGTPDSGTAAVIVEQGDAANLSDASTLFTLETALDIVTAAGAKDYHLLLQGAKRYIRVSITPTYVNGTSPGNLTAATFTLGDSNNEPVPTTGASAPTVWGA